MRFKTILTLIGAGIFGAASFASPSHVAEQVTRAFSGGSVVAPASGVEVAFSNGNGNGAEGLVLRAIGSAQKEIRVAAYSFTSKPIAQALVAAHKRGVDVQAVLDKSQRSEIYSSATFLANSGIPVRIDSAHAIQHSKFLVIDGETVQTGSLNYTASAVSRNSENVVVLWKSPEVAQAYLRDWNIHWSHAERYVARY